LGRSHGGLTTKVHLAADRRCRPIARVVTAGQRNDAVVFEAVMARIRIHPHGCGRPRTRPGRVLADKAYSSRAIRASLRRRGITATISEPADQQANRARCGPRGGRPPTFDPLRYKGRNVVERCVNKLKRVPRRRQPLRQARVDVRRHRRRRLDQDLAPRPGPMITSSPTNAQRTRSDTNCSYGWTRS
jgi:hypothetical protein